MNNGHLNAPYDFYDVMLRNKEHCRRERPKITFMRSEEIANSEGKLQKLATRCRETLDH